MRTAALILFGTAPLEACSCLWSGPLLKVAPHTDLVVRAKVLRYPLQRNAIDVAMDVQVLEVLKGSGRPGATVRIHGDDGASCRPYVRQFPIGTEWILAIQHLEEKPGDWFVSVCGAFSARVEGGMVVGLLTVAEPADRQERMSLAALRHRLSPPPRSLPPRR